MKHLQLLADNSTLFKRGSDQVLPFKKKLYCKTQLSYIVLFYSGAYQYSLEVIKTLNV